MMFPEEFDRAPVWMHGCINLIKNQQNALADWKRESDYFIPLVSSRSPTVASSLELDTEVDSFLVSPYQKVLLLVGHAGSGKSLYTQRLVQRQWDQYSSGLLVPLWISLPVLKNPEECAIEETLKNLGLNGTQIEELRKKQSFIFVFDAYDEIRCLKNLLVTNRLHRWHAKVIITCRHEYLYWIENFRLLFTPYEGNNPNFKANAVLYLKPFDANQVERYVSQYLKRHSSKTPWKSYEEYKNALDLIPGVNKLIQMPYALKLFVDVLPEISKSYEEVTDEMSKNVLTLAAVYDVFFNSWFERQEGKFKTTCVIKKGEDIKSEFWHYAKSLAKAMHSQQITQVFYDYDAEYSLIESEGEDNPWQSFFDPDDPKTQLLQSACLLREVEPKRYAFVHASLLEYFITRELYETSQSQALNVEYVVFDENEKEEELEIEKQKSKKGREDSFNTGLIVEEDRIIQFLADRISEEGGFKERMFAEIYASKNNSEGCFAAANAITILVRAGVVFNNVNFSGIHIPGANISGGYFDSADMSHADFSDVKALNVWLRHSNMEGSRLSGINFGEFPYLKEEHPVYDIDYREDLNRWLFVSGKVVSIWDIKENKCIQRLVGHEKEVDSARFGPKGNCVVSGSRDKTVRVWDVVSGNEIVVFEGHEGYVTCVDYSSVNNKVVSGSWDGTLCIWDVKTKKLELTLSEHEGEVDCVSFSSDGKRIVSGGYDKTIRVWDVATASSQMVLYGHDEPIACVAFSPSEHLVASGSKDKTIRIWDLTTQEVQVIFRGHEDLVLCVKFNSTGDQILSGSRDKTIRVWDLQTESVLRIIRGHEGYVNSVSFASGDKLVISGSSDRSIRICEAVGGKLETNTKHGKANNICLSLSGDQLAVGEQDHTIRVMDVLKGDVDYIFRGHTGWVNSVCFSPKGDRLISGSLDKTVRVWEIKQNPSLTILGKHAAEVTCVDVDLQGTQVVSGGKDNMLRVWDLGKYSERISIKAGGFSVNCISISPQNDKIASGNSKGIVSLWHLTTGDLLQELCGHKSSITCVKFNTKGDGVISGSNDKTLRVWDVLSGEEVSLLEGHDEKVTSVMFANSDDQVISASSDKTIRIWNISNQTCVLVLKMTTPVRDFSYHNSGVMLVAFESGEIQCWENCDEANKQWVLRWTTTTWNAVARFDGLIVNGVKDLSLQNRRFLAQAGAKIDTEELSLRSDKHIPLKVHVAQNTGSPIHEAAKNEQEKKNAEKKEKENIVKKEEKIKEQQDEKGSPREKNAKKCVIF